LKAKTNGKSIFKTPVNNNRKSFNKNFGNNTRLAWAEFAFFVNVFEAMQDNLSGLFLCIAVVLEVIHNAVKLIFPPGKLKPNGHFYTGFLIKSKFRGKISTINLTNRR